MFRSFGPTTLCRAWRMMRLYGTLITSLFVGSHASANEVFPARQIQIVIPFPAGGSLDIGMRLIQQRLSVALGVPLILVNRPGASGVIGMASVAAANPDGYTLGATSTSILTVVQIGTPNLPYKISDFTPIGNYAVDASALVVRAELAVGKLRWVRKQCARKSRCSELRFAWSRDAFILERIPVTFEHSPRAERSSCILVG